MKEVADILKPIITRSAGLQLLYQMLLIRRFEDKSAEQYTKTKIRGFLHLYNGEEAIAVGVMEALTKEDNVLCSYREHGQAIARGVDPAAIMAEMYGKEEGCSRGRGGSMHLFDAGKKFYGGSAIVAGHLHASVDLVADVSNRFTAHVEEMVDKGKISDTEGKKLVDEWIEKADTAREKFEHRVKELSQQFGFSEKTDEEELAQLKRKVADLQAKLGKTHHAHGHKKAAAV